MADDKVIDPDTLSDEEFMKLDVPPAEIVDPENKGDGDANASEDADKATADLAAATAGGGDGSEGSEAGDGKGGQEGGGTDGEGGGEEGGGKDTSGGDLTDEQKAEAAAAVEAETARVAALSEEERAAETATAEEEAAAELAKKDKGVNDDKETLKLKGDDKTKEAAAAKKLAEDEAAEAQGISDDFYKKVSAKFKADGKDVQVRTPEEAVRLMQMGVNYSRRMKEMKPLREMHSMLEAHGLNDPAKLNELVDLSKGGKEAIQAFLKKHNIDPLDLDPSKSEGYTAPSYQSDPKDVAFKDAIDNTLAAEGGKELLADVNKDWDAASKESLRENPAIFAKLLEQKDTGVYEQINAELLHQRTMGYLADVPFLQAYEQVGNAMQKAGAFDKKKEVQKKTGLAPIASGSRKVVPPKKVDKPNPNLSSAAQSRIVSNDTPTDEPDYLSMSDADFMKLGQPTG